MMAPNNVQSFTMPRVAYRGGLSSSICDLFSDPNERHDCCALVCCGCFLHDRNQYALTGIHPASRWGFVLPFMLLAVTVSVFLFPLSFVILGIEIGLIVVVILQSIKRARFRNQVIAQMTEEGSEEHYDNSCCSEARNAHRCFACIPIDGPPRPAHEISDKDICFHLWRMIAMLCYGRRGCWCNWCGMCAVAQEHRELRRMLPRERFWFDYITFQPYKEYASRIEMIRRSQTLHFWDHLSSLSTLSSKLLKCLILSIFLLVIAAAFLKNFSLANVMVIIFTLFQAFGVIYLVHWRNHRFDLSVDAIIKLFASGFFLAVSISVFIELILDQMGNFVFSILILSDYIDDNPDADFETPEDAPTSGQILHDMYEHHVMLLVAIVFFQSFIVAGLTEELSKYFGFWMVEHTDFMSEETVKDIIRSDDTVVAENSSIGIDQVNQPVYRRDIQSRAAAIRIGLIATAAGFACSENLMYTLGVGMSVKQELEILLLRSLLPLHPIAAAVQSLGIVERDIEKRGQLGRAVIPAIVLHGIFDFVVLLPSMLEVAKSPPPATPDGEESEPAEVKVGLLFLTTSLGFLTVVLGLVYYFLQERKQRGRLNALQLDRNDDADGIIEQDELSEFA